MTLAMRPLPLAQPMRTSRAGSRRGLAFEVSDLDAEVTRLQKLGAKFRGAISETPVCRFAMCSTRMQRNHHSQRGRLVADGVDSVMTACACDCPG